ncbi:hypothetical protein ACQPW3_23540 [Actinosynnema sp. CA-248983]
MDTKHARFPLDDYVSSTDDTDTRPYHSYYIVIPDDPAVGEDEDLDVELYDDEEDDGYYEPPVSREPTSSASAGRIGGVSAALVAGVVPALVVDLPAALAAGVAAGLFGGLMGRSLGIELHERRRARKEADRGY